MVINAKNQYLNIVTRLLRKVGRVTRSTVQHKIVNIPLYFKMTSVDVMAKNAAGVQGKLKS